MRMDKWGSSSIETDGAKDRVTDLGGIATVNQLIESDVDKCTAPFFVTLPCILKKSAENRQYSRLK